MPKLPTNAPKTLIVFSQEHQNRIIPQIKKLLTDKPREIDGEIYAVVNCPKYQLSFKDINLCDISGA